MIILNKVVIIGGGASGLVTAIKAKTKDNEVIILEKNDDCGKKILATGNGHCNYFNEDQSIKNYHSSQNELLDKIITKENMTKVLDFFDKLGLIPKIKNGYYYPLSNQASSMRNILLSKVNELNIKIKLNFLVEKIEKVNDKFYIYSKKEKIIADNVVVATGSYAGVQKKEEVLGYKILKSFNHTIEPVLPALVQLIGIGTYFKNWARVRTDATIKLYENNTFLALEKGEIQLTDYGISGICTFNISGLISKGLYQNKKEVVIIDFLPTLAKNKKDLSKILELRAQKLNTNNLLSFFEGMVNDKLLKTILRVSDIDFNKTYANLTEEEKEKIVTNLKEFKLQIVKTKSYENAQTCIGGVKLDEINLKTMESKYIKKLYIVGELVDIDGLCGGYNLSFAWLSGILAGSDISD